MPDETTKKHKHLTLDDREEIQGCLNHGMTFKAIGQRIGKDQTTVSKEVKRHLVSQPLEHRAFDGQGNPLPPEPCPRHLKPPFCCNPCEKKNRLCAFQKRYYHAKPAQKAYESLLVAARDGVPLGRESFYEMDDIIARQMKKGQHLYHILQTQDLAVSKSSVYRYLHKGYLSAAKMDFPRVVKFKPRQPRQQEYIKVSAHEFGHVLGVGDLYGKGLASTQECPQGMFYVEGDMMGTHGKVIPNDIEMMLEAYRTGRYQAFITKGKEKKSSVIRSY